MAKAASSSANVRMPARYFLLLCELLQAGGVNAEAVLRVARIAPAQIYQPGGSVTLQQCEALIDEAERASGRRDLSFALGRRIKLSSHEILGYGILTSPTLDYAITLAARYYRLMTPWFRLQYRRAPRQSEAHFQPAMPMPPRILNFLLEMVVVSAHEQVKSLMQDHLPAYDVFVSYPEPPYARSYRELRPAQFHFAAEDLPGARMVLDAEVVARPLPMADATALKLAENRCSELMQRTAQASGVSEWVSMMLRESHEGSPSLAELSRLLNLSPRTLDRHLEREGSRFLDLSKRIRHERACELLKAGVSVTQVAYQVGYRDPANFTRAFRRDCGKSPRDYVMQMAGD